MTPSAHVWEEELEDAVRPWVSSPNQVSLWPSFSLCGMHTTLPRWDHGETGKRGGTCLPLPSSSCWGISVLARRYGNNPLSSHPFLYRHDPENEGENAEDCQSWCREMHSTNPTSRLVWGRERSQPGVTGPDRLNILSDLLPFRERQCSLAVKGSMSNARETGSNSSSTPNKLCDLRTMTQLFWTSISSSVKWGFALKFKWDIKGLQIKGLAY